MVSQASISSPLTLPCGSTIKNRLIKAAMTEGLATAKDHATPRHAALYKRWAKGGAAVLITGNVMVDKRYLERAGNVVVEDESGMRELEAWAEAAHQEDCQLWAQISHPGRQCPRMVNTTPLSASDVQLNMIGNFGKPRAATIEDIEDVVKRFATTAGILKQAGFDGVQIHSAHGYLLSQFLSPTTNHRSDQYGGSLENRARLLREVISAVRSEVGHDFPIAVKLNSSDFQKGGFSHDESIQVVKWLNEDGIDLLEISGGTYEQLEFFKQDDADVRASTKKREAYFLEYAAAIKEVATMPIMVTGGFRSTQAMNMALTQGDCDVIGLARPLCVNPEAPNQLIQGVIHQLSTEEGHLVLGKGWLGPNSRSRSIQALNNQAQAGWYYGQIERLAASLESKPDLSPKSALFSHLGKDTRRALRRKFAR